MDGKMHLWLWAFGLFAGYWLLAWLAPDYWVAALVSAAQTVFGAFVFVSWLPSALRILNRGQSRGEHLSLLGVTLLAAGSCYAGFYKLAWIVAGHPETWMGSPASIFGRALMTVGFVLFILSPGALRGQFKAPPWWLIAAGIAVVAMFSFILGTRWEQPTITP